MPDLPTGDYAFYAGIDPGFSGAVAVMNAAGTSIKVFDMPTTPATKDRQREMDLAGLRECFRYLRRLPSVALGIEWPTTRPGEGAERSERFGRGKGYLEAFAYLHNLDYYRLAPNLWKGRLGLPGKEKDPNSAASLRFWRAFYPERASMVVGPRGGVIDGRLDALLICHFLRMRTTDGFQSVAVKFGKGSPEAMAAIFGTRRKRGMPVWRDPNSVV